MTEGQWHRKPCERMMTLSKEGGWALTLEVPRWTSGATLTQLWRHSTHCDTLLGYKCTIHCNLWQNSCVIFVLLLYLSLDLPTKKRTFMLKEWKAAIMSSPWVCFSQGRNCSDMMFWIHTARGRTHDNATTIMCTLCALGSTPWFKQVKHLTWFRCLPTIYGELIGGYTWRREAVQHSN